MDKDYTVFIDGWVDGSRPGSAINYQIAICPFSRNASAMAVKRYETREALETDIRRYFGYTDKAIERYFAQPDLMQALVHPLSDEVAAYFGWV
jgi:hypothetical protein